MTFKQFKLWCNERACDGCWGMREAIICLDVCKVVCKIRPWKRERVWREINEAYGIEKNIVCPINEKIQKFVEGNGNGEN